MDGVVEVEGLEEVGVLFPFLPLLLRKAGAILCFLVHGMERCWWGV